METYPELHSTSVATYNFMDHVGDAIVSMVFSLTIIPRVSVEYELVIIISYPTSARGIIVLTKTRTKYREFFPALFVNTTDFQLVFNFEQTRTWRAWYNGSYTMLAEPIRTLELHYPMIPMNEWNSVFNNIDYFGVSCSSNPQCFGDSQLPRGIMLQTKQRFQHLFDKSFKSS